ncbi:NifU family protein [Actinoallomurus purpureus]|uniref:NifU family protein n=1 Tax=Actinoallomurus purpureus TaxID=478114 RepID=UPI0020931225|nr:NifU family protein [Actinoallomurus purpureus]MCO6005569.1 NifU family protein [Actinoallomurus purpureus]
MPETYDVRTTGDRVDALLAELGRLADATTVAKVEELLRSVVGLYGAGLERVMEIVTETGAAEALRRLTGDELVSGLLILHELHPLTAEERVLAALDDVRPYLGLHDGGVELLGIDDEGVVRLRLEGTCHGCPSSRVTVAQAIERAIAGAAPEISRVDVDGLVPEPEPPLLQIGPRPPGGPITGTGADPDGRARPYAEGGLDGRARPDGADRRARPVGNAPPVRTPPGPCPVPEEAVR